MVFYRRTGIRRSGFRSSGNRRTGFWASVFWASVFWAQVEVLLGHHGEVLDGCVAVGVHHEVGAPLAVLVLVPVAPQVPLLDKFGEGGAQRLATLGAVLDQPVGRDVPAVLVRLDEGDDAASTEGQTGVADRAVLLDGEVGAGRSTVGVLAQGVAFPSTEGWKAVRLVRYADGDGALSVTTRGTAFPSRCRSLPMSGGGLPSCSGEPTYSHPMCVDKVD